jgi:hypothetical protein
LRGDSKSEESEGGGEAEAACTGSPLSAAPKLPAKFPTFESVTYTQQSTQGPTDIVEGYYEGDVEGAHDEVKAALENAGFTTPRSPGKARAAQVRSRCARSAATATARSCISRVVPNSSLSAQGAPLA